MPQDCSPYQATELLSVFKDSLMRTKSFSLLFSQVEYDLMSSGVDDLKLLSTDRIEQSGIPTAMTWFPPLTKESFILVANDQVRLIYITAATRHTFTARDTLNLYSDLMCSLS